MILAGILTNQLSGYYQGTQRNSLKRFTSNILILQLNSICKVHVTSHKLSAYVGYIHVITLLSIWPGKYSSCLDAVNFILLVLIIYKKNIFPTVLTQFQFITCDVIGFVDEVNGVWYSITFYIFYYGLLSSRYFYRLDIASISAYSMFRKSIQWICVQLLKFVCVTW